MEEVVDNDDIRRKNVFISMIYNYGVVDRNKMKL